jgi:2-polyprenyl-6-methoxyphenol hydroxylase-like FAD-dependent oxidoreductase
MKNQNILISGGGIAGLTLAYWLHQYGFQPTIVEKRAGLNDEGYMIDFYGSGFDVAEKMGLLEPLAARHYPVYTLRYVDAQGKTRASFDIQQFRRLLNFRHYNFMRGDLEAVLYDAVKEKLPVRMDTTISTIQPQDACVQVQLSDGAQQEFDLVIGADGIHSGIRRFLWGEQEQFEHFLGYYVACGIIDNFMQDQDAFISFIEPHKQISVYPIRGGRMATFLIFQAEREQPHQREAQQAKLEQVYAGLGWHTAQILERMRKAPDFYFDSVSQIKLDVWRQGRVALVGDSCQCLTLLAGQGASMAMAGAYRLAQALDRSGGDYQAAFQAYQDGLKPEIEQRQLQAEKLASSFVPDSYRAIWLQNLFLKFAALPVLKGIFLRLIGARSIIK